MSSIKYKASLAAVLLASVAPGALAQNEVADSEASELSLDTVTVTANKREQSLQDVAASVSALTAESLDARGLTDITQLQFAVPNVTFGEFLGELNVAIRGVGQFNRQPGVAVSVDGIYQARTTTAGLYQLDVGRVEVLRGPQGTLYGRNSNGGAVNFITAEPTDEFEAYVRAGYAEFDQYSLEGVVSGPLSDRVSARLSANYVDQNDGWIENRVPGVDDLESGELANARLRVSADVTDNFTLDFLAAFGMTDGASGHYAFLDNRIAETVANTPPNTVQQAIIDAVEGVDYTTEPLQVFADTPTETERDYSIIGLTAELDMGWATLKSITGYQEFVWDRQIDRDGTRIPLFPSFDRDDQKTFSQELNLLGEGDNYNWVLGAFYMHDDFKRRLLFDTGVPTAFFPAPSFLDFTSPKYDTESIALFADATFELTDRARLSAGVRYTEDEIDQEHFADISAKGPNGEPILAVRFCPPFGPNGEFPNVDSTVNFPTKEKWSDTTYRAVGQYDVTDASNVYASFSQGYKSGGVDQFTCFGAYDPETIDAYELGYKGAFAGGRANLAASVFFYDYTDFQLVQAGTLGTIVINADGAELRGVEIEGSALLNENWSLDGAVTFLDSEFQEFESVDVLNRNSGFVNVAGNPLPNAPETTVLLGVNYRSSAPWGGDLNFRADANYRSRVHFREFGAREDTQDPYTVANLNLLWDSEDRSWGVRLFATNVTDEEYVTALQAVELAGGLYGSWGMPRQVGFEITRRFGAR